MGRKLIDYTGYKIGRLEVVETYRRNGRTFCKCKCECGNIVNVRVDSIKKNGETRSCGCLAEDMRNGNVKVNVTHGLSYNKLYRYWDGMKKRCYSPSHDSYKWYGATGVKICDEWLHDFKSFYDWSIENGYREGLSIDRIDPSKDYSPTNCRWVTLSEQANNRSNNVRTDVNGEILNIAQVAKKYNLNENTVRGRYKRGKRGNELISPVKPKNKTTPR
ncbi:hypothetical protein [Bacillus licheniformis]|uniref:hypothetical protein n=1 Tax=Bacillus licheniformis TaxID=1402 RepID=UPI00041C1893|nr:hypothetical protein [Bacillus licheniformis]KYC82578.1 hypothetical protein B4091_1422 [Bacillus licheniformis]TWL13307.1 hypothetical protein CHCC16874_2709 [Bacillus licheniformis]